MPITRPEGSTSAPPELPGLIAALVWMADERVAPLPSGTLRFTAETMPSVTLERSPSGLPRASVMSPTSTCEESAKVAGQERGDVRFVHQSMYYPVTDAAMDTGSYEQFADGYFLTAKMMEWFWDAYAPDVERRLEPLASPLRASDEQLAGLPPAFVIVDEADVLRDEGEAYAARLRAAGTPVTTVRYDGITHDFMMLNPLRDTHATRAAIDQATAVLRKALHTT
jgi:hypothetical protein